MSKGKKPRQIDVDFYYNENDVGRVGFVLQTSDNKPMSAQDIVDVISETLLYHYDYFDLETSPKQDS